MSVGINTNYNNYYNDVTQTKQTQNSTKKMLTEAPAYAKLDDEVQISRQARFQSFFEQFNKATQNDGASGLTKKYDELYKGIMKNSPENEHNELTNLLDSAFEYSAEFYASSMSFRMMSLSGVKLKAEIPPLGSSQAKKPDTRAFDTMLEKRDQLTNEIKNLFSNFPSNYRANREYSSVTNNGVNSMFNNNSNILTISDLDVLSKGFMTELQDMKKNGDSNEKVLDKIGNSNLSSYAKQLLTDIVEINRESKLA